MGSSPLGCSHNVAHGRCRRQRRRSRVRRNRQPDRRRADGVSSYARDHPIVVGVDGTERSGAAIAFAFAAARDRDCGGTLVRAVERDVLRADVEAKLASLGTGHADRRVVVPADLASEALIEESRGAPLLVVESRGRGGLGGMLSGSVSQAVVHRAHCPVAVVRAVTRTGSAI